MIICTPAYNQECQNKAEKQVAIVRTDYNGKTKNVQNIR